VPHYRRAVLDPISIAYAATITPNASQGSLFRCTATGPITLADPTGGVDGQVVRIEITASGADRVLTLTSIATTITITSGSKWAGELVYDGTDWWVTDGTSA